jgi:hypothetical protein
MPYLIDNCDTLNELHNYTLVPDELTANVQACCQAYETYEDFSVLADDITDDEIMARYHFLTALMKGQWTNALELFNGLSPSIVIQVVKLDLRFEKGCALFPPDLLCDLIRQLELAEPVREAAAKRITTEPPIE